MLGGSLLPQILIVGPRFGSVGLLSRYRILNMFAYIVRKQGGVRRLVGIVAKIEGVSDAIDQC